MTMISASTACPRAAGNRARDEQDDDERVREELQQLNDGRQTTDRSRLVRAVLGEAPRRLGAAQSRFGARHPAETLDLLPRHVGSITICWSICILVLP